MPALTLAILSLALLASALSAGLFFAFSVFVMQGLGSAPPAAAIEAMRGINGAIRNPLFLFAFLGPLLLSFAGSAAALLQGSRPAALLALAAFLVYAVAVFGVTLRTNLPLNEALDRARPTASDAPASAAHRTWTEFATPWTRANHLRTAGAIVTFALLTGSLVAAALVAASHRPDAHS